MFKSNSVSLLSFPYEFSYKMLLKILCIILVFNTVTAANNKLQRGNDIENKSERQERSVDKLIEDLQKRNYWLSPTYCTEAKKKEMYNNIMPNYSYLPFEVICDAVVRQDEWTIILKRIDGSLDFYRNWTEYKNGFGTREGEFFLGLEKIHTLTTESRQELLVLLEDCDGIAAFEIYDEFQIGNEAQQYKLNSLGKCMGPAGDSLGYQLGMNFSTHDRDNDPIPFYSCAKLHNGAWWYKNTYQSQLTGTYKNIHWQPGMFWETFRYTPEALKTAAMILYPHRP